jgi:hypothetical protein
VAAVEAEQKRKVETPGFHMVIDKIPEEPEFPCKCEYFRTLSNTTK